MNEIFEPSSLEYSAVFTIARISGSVNVITCFAAQNSSSGSTLANAGL